VEQLVAPLNRHQPEFLYGYPSILEQFAAEQQAGRLHIAPTTLVSCGEAHTVQTRRAIRAVWDVPWFDQYGAAEAPMLAAHCPAHTGLHLFEDLTIVEVVDEHHQPVPAGRPGTECC
jgi:phenylacetate-CoA ligase